MFPVKSWFDGALSPQRLAREVAFTTTSQHSVRLQLSTTYSENNTTMRNSYNSSDHRKGKCISKPKVSDVHAVQQQRSEGDLHSATSAGHNLSHTVWRVSGIIVGTTRCKLQNDMFAACCKGPLGGIVEGWIGVSGLCPQCKWKGKERTLHVITHWRHRTPVSSRCVRKRHVIPDLFVAFKKTVIYYNLGCFIGIVLERP